MVGMLLDCYVIKMYNFAGKLHVDTMHPCRSCIMYVLMLYLLTIVSLYGLWIFIKIVTNGFFLLYYFLFQKSSNKYKLFKSGSSVWNQSLANRK